MPRFAAETRGGTVESVHFFFFPPPPSAAVESAAWQDSQHRLPPPASHRRSDRSRKIYRNTPADAFKHDALWRMFARGLRITTFRSHLPRVTRQRRSLGSGTVFPSDGHRLSAPGRGGKKMIWNYYPCTCVFSVKCAWSRTSKLQKKPPNFQMSGCSISVGNSSAVHQLARKNWPACAIA